MNATEKFTSRGTTARRITQLVRELARNGLGGPKERVSEPRFCRHGRIPKGLSSPHVSPSGGRSISKNTKYRRYVKRKVHKSPQIIARTGARVNTLLVGLVADRFGQGVLIKGTGGAGRSCMECGGCDAALDRTRTSRRNPKRRRSRRTPYRLAGGGLRRGPRHLTTCIKTLAPWHGRLAHESHGRPARGTRGNPRSARPGRPCDSRAGCPCYGQRRFSYTFWQKCRNLSGRAEIYCEEPAEEPAVRSTKPQAPNNKQGPNTKKPSSKRSWPRATGYRLRRFFSGFQVPGSAFPGHWLRATGHRLPATGY